MMLLLLMCDFSMTYYKGFVFQLLFSNPTFVFLQLLFQRAMKLTALTLDKLFLHKQCNLGRHLV